MLCAGGDDPVLRMGRPPTLQKARIELGKRIGFYPAEKVEHPGMVATKLELTDEDRVSLRKAIDSSINKLMEAGREKSA